MNALDVQTALAMHHDEKIGERTVLKVKARNVGDRDLTLVGCVILPPAGLRIYSDPPHLDYPLSLSPTMTCYDWLDCHTVAEILQEMGCSGVVELTAMFLEEGGPSRMAMAMYGPFGNAARTDLRGAEHRSDPFAFEIARWLVT
jgi:hypothetical protein